METDPGCIWITDSHEDGASDGIYKIQPSRVWGNEAGTRVLVFQDGGWNGCIAVNYIPNADCFPFNRWGFITDLTTAIDSNVNIWSGTGSSSGITNQCEVTVNSKIMFSFFINLIIDLINVF